MPSRFALAALSFLALSALMPSQISAASQYADLGGAGVHRTTIEALEEAGVLAGTECGAERFCPDQPLPRWVMAVWLVRALQGDRTPAVGAFTFADVDRDAWWAGYVQRLAILGVTRGCAVNPFRYCPDQPVTRGEMASFLTRAFDLDSNTGQSLRFTDTEGSLHARDIEALAASNITVGCAADPFRYCPDRWVTRGEMATFLARALDLAPTVEYLLDTDGRRLLHLVSQYTTYHPCCDLRVTNIHLFADRIDGVVVRPGRLFSLNRHVGRRTTEKGYLAAGTLINGELVDSVGGGVSQVATTLYNAVFWGGYQNVSHQPHSRYFSRYPEGIEATLDWPRVDLIFRNDSSRNVIIKTEYTLTSLTVKLFGDNDGRMVVGEWKGGRGHLEVMAEGGGRSKVVTAELSGRADVTSPPSPLYRSNRDLGFDETKVRQPAMDGWTVNVTRVIEQGGSRTVEQWKVRYLPLRAIIEVHPCALVQSCRITST